AAHPKALALAAGPSRSVASGPVKPPTHTGVRPTALSACGGPTWVSAGGAPAQLAGAGARGGAPGPPRRAVRGARGPTAVAAGGGRTSGAAVGAAVGAAGARVSPPSALCTSGRLLRRTVSSASRLKPSASRRHVCALGRGGRTLPKRTRRGWRSLTSSSSSVRRVLGSPSAMRQDHLFPARPARLFVPFYPDRFACRLTVARAMPNSVEQTLPRMSEHALGRADEIRTPRLLGSQSDDEGRSIGQHDPRRDGGPARQRRALQAEETEQAEHPAKEALDTGTLSQLVSGPGGRQAVAPALRL